MKIQRQNKNKTRNLIILIVVVLFLCLGGGYVYAAHRYAWFPFTQSLDKSQKQENNSDTTYGSTKTDNSVQTPDSSNSSTKTSTKNGSSEANSAGTVGVGVASARVSGTKMEVRAFVNDIIKGDGTCTAIFTKDNLKVTGSAPAFIDASTTQCEAIEIDTSRFTESGTWQLVVQYKSSEANGSSSTMDVKL